MENRHVWEGWTVNDFIRELEIIFIYQKDTLTDKNKVKEWCMSNQPYYKKHIPEVYKHFCNKLKLT